MTGIKHDQAKPRMDLLDPDWLEGVAQALTFGASKYAPHNWRGGIAYSRLIAAAYRHLGAINRGEDVDPESGQQHAHHAACCLMFLSNMIATRPDLDDRYTGLTKNEPLIVSLRWKAHTSHSTYEVARIYNDTDPTKVRFEYNPDWVDGGLRRNEPGWEGHPAFPLRIRVHTINVMGALSPRLPPRTREDFPEFLKRFKLPPNFTHSDLALLAHTGGTLPGDRFHFEKIL